MNTLHIINKSGDPFLLCSRALTTGDALILIEDGIYLLSTEQNKLADIAQRHSIFILDADLTARGIDINAVTSTVTDYQGFVKLTTQYDNTLSWF